MAHYKGAAKEAGRAAILMKKREKEQQDLEERKKRIEEELAIGNINNKFASHYDAVEQRLKSDTVGLYSRCFFFFCLRKNWNEETFRMFTNQISIKPWKYFRNLFAKQLQYVRWEGLSTDVFLAGLVTLNEMRAKQEDIVKEREKQIAIKKGEAAKLGEEQKESGRKKKKSKQVWLR